MIDKEKIAATRKMPHVMVGLGATIITKTVPVAAVDRDGNIYINPNPPESVASTDFPPGYVLCHESLHYTLHHFNRGEGKNPLWWNKATDCVIASMLEQIFDGYIPPPSYVHPKHLGFPSGLTAEEYYRLIEKQEQDKANGSPDSGDGSPNQDGSDDQGECQGKDKCQGKDGSDDENGSHQGKDKCRGKDSSGQGKGKRQGKDKDECQGKDGSDYADVGNSMDQDRPWEKEAPTPTGKHSNEEGEDKPTFPKPKKDFSSELRNCGINHKDIQAAANHVAGSNPGNAISKMSSPPIIDPRLYDFCVEQMGWGDWTYRSPRFTQRPFILPSFKGGQRVAVIVDSSGSMWGDRLRTAVGLINGLLVNGVTVDLVEGDTGVANVTELSCAGEIEIRGCGGTDMRAVYLEALPHIGMADMVVMMTDCETDSWPAPSEISIPLVVVRIGSRYMRVPQHIPVLDAKGYVED